MCEVSFQRKRVCAGGRRKRKKGEERKRETFAGQAETTCLLHINIALKTEKKYLSLRHTHKRSQPLSFSVLVGVLVAAAALFAKPLLTFPHPLPPSA